MKKIIITIAVMVLAFLLVTGVNQKYHEYKSDMAWSTITRDANEDDFYAIETDDYTIKGCIIHEGMR